MRFINKWPTNIRIWVSMRNKFNKDDRNATNAPLGSIFDQPACHLHVLVATRVEQKVDRPLYPGFLHSTPDERLAENQQKVIMTHFEWLQKTFEVFQIFLSPPSDISLKLTEAFCWTLGNSCHMCPAYWTMAEFSKCGSLKYRSFIAKILT